MSRLTDCMARLREANLRNCELQDQLGQRDERIRVLEEQNGVLVAEVEAARTAGRGPVGRVNRRMREGGHHERQDNTRESVTTR